MLKVEIKNENWLIFGLGVISAFIALMVLSIIFQPTQPVLKAGFASYPNKNLICVVQKDNVIASCFAVAPDTVTK